MKITVLAPYTFNYIDAIVDKLREYPDVEVTYINYEKVKYQYPSTVSRVYNFFLKTFTGKNLKKQFITEQLIDKLAGKADQDYILVIRPDKLERKLLLHLRNKTNKLISYYFDPILKFPKKGKLIDYFDEVYSYEKEDVVKYKLKFLTNFIPYD
ncbi:hypothetical protein [Leeuwenhoekiella sp. NPDC079379]|uniref:hypothetical protein n=1 Tax=Leeuwenhoekiella sp. NPDC079379 TaxID=3364122 RepID=UPI0037CA58DB